MLYRLLCSINTLYIVFFSVLVETFLKVQAQETDNGEDGTKEGCQQAKGCNDLLCCLCSGMYLIVW